MWCVLNDLKQTHFWLKLAVELKHPNAQEFLNELIEKGLIDEEIDT